MGGDIIAIKNITQSKCYKIIKKYEATPLFILIDNFPKKGKDVDYLFYFLSRLGEYNNDEFKESSVSLIILLNNRRDFYGKISDATMSSLLPIHIKYSQKGKITEKLK